MSLINFASPRHQMEMYVFIYLLVICQKLSETLLKCYGVLPSFSPRATRGRAPKRETKRTGASNNAGRGGLEVDGRRPFPLVCMNVRLSQENA